MRIRHGSRPCLFPFHCPSYNKRGKWPDVHLLGLTTSVRETVSHPLVAAFVLSRLNLQDVLESGEQKNQYGKIRDLKKAARVFNFLQENNISTLPELREKYSEILTRYDNARNNVRFIEQRMNALAENIRQGEIYLEHRKLYAEYKNLKPRKQSKFYEAHRANLMIFEAAKRYFKERHIGSDFSLTSWRDEREKLIKERSKIYREYNAIKAQFSDVETVRLDAEQIAREAARNRNQPKKEKKARGMER